MTTTPCFWTSSVSVYVVAPSIVDATLYSSLVVDRDVPTGVALEEEFNKD